MTEQVAAERVFYKMKFKYANDGIKVSGDGDCNGQDYDEALTNAQNGVAKSLNGDPANVVITSMTRFTPKKKKKKAA